MPASNQPATSHAYDYLVRALQLLEKPRMGRVHKSSTQDIPDALMEIAPHSWITGAEAISADGTYVAPEDERAEAWCTIGVVKAVTKYDDNPDAAYRYVLSIMNAANPMYVAEGSSNAQPALNDSGSFELVQKFFQRAIAMAARLESKQQSKVG